MKLKLLVVPAVAVSAVAVMASPAFAQTGGSARVQVILDNIWILVAAVLVIFMQAGFALVEAGLTRGKNVGNIVMKNMMDFCCGVLAFALVGFTIAFVTIRQRLLRPRKAGCSDSRTPSTSARSTLPTYFIFQVAFAATAATIVSGAMAERTKFKSYLIYSVAITALIYPVVVHWFWGGGWLAQMDTPFIDFAGSTVVHSVGGWAALIGALVLGPRIGKYGADGKPRAIPGHNIAFASSACSSCWSAGSGSTRAPSSPPMWW